MPARGRSPDAKYSKLGAHKLMSLDAEKKTILKAESVIRVEKIASKDVDIPILKQLEFFEK